MIPPHERRILEAHIRGIPLSALPFHQEKPLDEYQNNDLKNLIRLRMKGLPLQYLTGSQAFYGRDFYVNTGVFIPRPETEGLVELALKKIPQFISGQKLKGLEFGTGSGCIGITLALERPDLEMIASECMEDAFRVAEENASKHRVMNINFLQVSQTPEFWQYEDVGPLDLLISNPPYLMQDDEIAADVREHEPPEALFSLPHDAVYFYRFLAELAQQRLKPEGVGLFEIAEQRGQETAEVFRQKGFKVEVLNDLTERPRYVVINTW